MPFPEQEQYAVEAVVLFAIHQLHFEPADIRLFGWSIGGFTAIWAAMHLPSVGGLVRCVIHFLSHKLSGLSVCDGVDFQLATIQSGSYV